MPVEQLGMMTNKNILVIHSSKNVKGRHDATGAFIPEAEKFAKLQNVPKENIVGINCIGTGKKKRRDEVVKALFSSDRLWDAICFFGHGWPRGIQFGYGLDQIDELAFNITATSTFSVKVMLYACLAAENDVRDNVKAADELGPATDGGFADELRDELYRLGVIKGWVDGHKTAGHTSWNPYVVRFRSDAVMSELYGAVGGAWLVQPGSEYWNKWVNKMKGNTGFRYRVPFMTELEIRAELANKVIRIR